MFNLKNEIKKYSDATRLAIPLFDLTKVGLNPEWDHREYVLVVLLGGHNCKTLKDEELTKFVNDWVEFRVMNLIDIYKKSNMKLYAKEFTPLRDLEMIGLLAASLYLIGGSNAASVRENLDITYEHAYRFSLELFTSIVNLYKREGLGNLLKPKVLKEHVTSIHGANVALDTVYDIVVGGMSAKQIVKEFAGNNAEVYRALTILYGVNKFMGDSGQLEYNDNIIKDRDDVRLFYFDFGQPVGKLPGVELINHTIEPQAVNASKEERLAMGCTEDGFKICREFIPQGEYKTLSEAVGWGFGLSGDEYIPDVET